MRELARYRLLSRCAFFLTLATTACGSDPNDEPRSPNDAVIVPPGVVSTVFGYDDTGRLLGEYDDSGNPVEELVYVEGRLVALARGGKVYAVQTDRIGAPRAVLDANKAIWRWDPEPFGSTSPDEDPDGDGKKLAFDERFPGQRVDAVSRLHRNGHRNYAPELGRYVEADPIGLHGGANLYAYVAGNPLRWTDRRGLSVEGSEILVPTEESMHFPTPKPKSKEVCEAIKRLAEYEKRMGGKDAYARSVLRFGDGSTLSVYDGNVGPTETVDGFDFNYAETAYAGSARGGPMVGAAGNLVYIAIGATLHVARGALTPRQAMKNAAENFRGTELGLEAQRYGSFEEYYKAVCGCP
jgi:RHS repeat-associated protein